MFEVGRLVARILIEGKQAAKSDLGEVEQSFTKAAAGAKHTAQDATTAGTALTGTGQRAKAAAADLGTVAKAASEVSSAQARSAAASTKLDEAMTRESATAGRVRVATAQLAEANQKYAADSSQVIAAQERLTAAQGQNALAQGSVAAASKNAADAAEKVADAVQRAGNATAQATPKVRGIRDEIAGLSDAGQQAAREVGAGFAGIGTGILAFVGLAVSKAADFDKAMSAVGAATMAPRQEIDALRAQALELGADTKYSATEAAEGITALAKAGVTTGQIMGGGLAGSLSLAAAGEIEVGEAAEIAATAMTQFGLAGDKIPHLADLLAAGAGKAQGSVDDLAMALKQGGLVAAQMGLSVEDTTGVLAQFASAGLLGSDAGTSLKTMLLSLANPSKESAGLMKELGINAYDAAGNFVGIESVAGQLETRLGGLTQQQRDSALATIFGSDAIRAASVLYEDGAAGVREWADNVNDAGYAARQASMLQDNLAGDVEKLGGAFDTALIQSGSAANDVLRQIVQTVTTLVDGFGSLPAPVIESGVAIATGVGGFLLFAGVGLTVIGRLGDMRKSFRTLNEEMPKTTKLATGLAKGFGIIAGLGTAAKVLDAIATSGQKAAPSLEETARAMKKLDGLDDIFGKLDGAGPVDDLDSALKRLLNNDLDGNLDGFNRWASGINQALGGQFSDSTQVVRDQFAAIDESLSSLVSGGDAETAAQQFQQIAAAAAEQGYSLEQVKELFPQYAEASIAAAEATAAGEEVTHTSAEAYLAQAGSVEDVVDQLNQLLEAFNALNEQNQDSIGANISYQESLAATQEQIAAVKAGTEGYSTSLDITTEAGRSNTGVLIEQAKASQEAAQKQYELDVKTVGAKQATENLKGALQAGRDTLIANATELSGNADEAKGFADQVYAIPESKDFELVTNTAIESAAVKQFIADLNNIPGRRDVVINQVVQTTGAPRGQVGAAYGNNGMVVKAYASGGVRENHVAQIARAGEWRVWAEEETGGETYIPHAISKRAQSTKYLDYTADLFGYQLVPKGATPFAGGGATVGPAVGASGAMGRPVYFGDVLVAMMRETASGAVIEALDQRSKQTRDVLARNGIG